MREEDHALQRYYLEAETRIEQNNMEEEAKSAKEREIEKIWKAQLLEDAEEKKRTILQLMESAEHRGSKGKKRKGKKGGKKKKK